MSKHFSDIQLVHNALFVRKLAQESGVNVEGMLSGLVSEIGNEVKHLDSPEAVLDFLVPGVLWTFNMPWIAALYTLAEALGFDFKKFFAEIREKLSGYVHELFAGKKGDPSVIHRAVEESAESAFDGKPQPEKVVELVQKTSSLNNKQLVSFALFGKSRPSFSGNSLTWVEEITQKILGGVFGRQAKRGITRTLIRVFSFLLSAVFYSLGFLAAKTTLKHLFNSGKKTTEEGSQTDSDSSSTSSPSAENEQEQNTKNDANKKSNVILEVNPHLDGSYISTTFNDMSHVWMMHESVSNIRERLINWARDVYPQLTDMNAFNQSTAFNRTLKLFQDRNKDAENLQIMAVPEPFTSIKQIVDSFAADVAAHTEDQ